jgi:hypothetical protein
MLPAVACCEPEASGQHVWTPQLGGKDQLDMLHYVDLPDAEVSPFVNLLCLRHKCEPKRVPTQWRKPKGGGSTTFMWWFQCNQGLGKPRKSRIKTGTR